MKKKLLARLRKEQPLGKISIYENRPARIITLPRLPWLVTMTARLPVWGIPVDVQYTPRSIKLQF